MEQNLELYYDSQHWKEIKFQVKHKFPNGCILTSSPEYDVHHLNYISLNKEIIGLDILPLNSLLHTEFHKWIKSNKKGFYDLEAFAEYKGIKLSKNTKRLLSSAKIYNIELRLKNKDRVKVKIYQKKKTKKKIKTSRKKKFKIGARNFKQYSKK